MVIAPSPAVVGTVDEHSDADSFGDGGEDDPTGEETFADPR